jgi:glycosyltransferase involved in cell wall biosynthesis
LENRNLDYSKKMTATPLERPFVSIIVPCYNGRNYIRGLAEALTTVRKETFEVIFVDDGSTDGTAEIFGELMPDSIVLRQANSGVANARNTGARAARGEFLQLLDADDIIRPGKLYTQAAFAKKGDLDVVYSGWQMVVVDGKRRTREPACDRPMPCEPVAALLGGWWVPPHAYLVRRSAYWDVGGSDPTLVNAQDFDVILRMAIANKKFAHMPGCFADYYRYEKATSLARGPREQYWTDYERATDKAISLLGNQGALSSERRTAAAQKFHAVARNVYSFDKARFNTLIQKITELDPFFQPQGSSGYRIAARLLGLQKAEEFAALVGRIRRRFRP